MEELEVARLGTEEVLARCDWAEGKGLEVDIILQQGLDLPQIHR